MSALSELWGLEESALDALVARAAQESFASTGDAGPGPALAGGACLPMAGDRLLAGACRALTREVELEASPPEVWPWVAQLMRGAGMYGWPALESVDCQSAVRLLEGLPPPRLGDQVHRAFILVRLDPGAEIVWAACEPLRLLGRDITGLTLNYLIQPIPADLRDPGASVRPRTQLLARLRFTAAGMTDRTAQRLGAALELLLIRSQLNRISDCIRRSRAADEQADAANRRVGPYQHASFKPAMVSMGKAAG